MPRDYTKPLTVEDLKQLSNIFRSMPTYEESFSASELGEACKKIEYERTAEQVDSMVFYFEKYFGGRVPIQMFVDAMTNVYNTAECILVSIKVYDKNGDGFIDKDEFEEFKELVAIHDPRLKHTDFAQLVNEADTDKDGKISIEELSKWISKKLKGNV